jgi:hypothetical protein
MAADFPIRQDGYRVISIHEGILQSAAVAATTLGIVVAAL